MHIFKSTQNEIYFVGIEIYVIKNIYSLFKGMIKKSKFTVVLISKVESEGMQLREASPRSE